MENNIKYIKSEALQGILNKETHFLLRWGLLLLFLIGVFILSVSLIIKIPVTVSAPVVVTTTITPKPISIKNNGKLILFNCIHGDSVSQGELVGVMESLADHKKVFQLEKDLETFSDTDFTEIIIANNFASFRNYTDLGEIQNFFELFYKSLKELEFALSDEFLKAKIDIVKDKIKNTELILKNLYKQQATLKKDYEIALNKYLTEKDLHDKGITSLYELKNYESAMLSKKLNLDNIQTSILGTISSKNDYRESLLNLTQSSIIQKNNFLLNLHSLLSEITKWKSQFLLFSPIDGIVSTIESVNLYQEMSAGNILCYVLPHHTKYLCEIRLPQENFSKIKLGMPVKIKLDAYDIAEFGYAQALLVKINTIPANGTFLAIGKPVEDKNSKKIILKYGLTGKAEIILGEKSLFSRIVSKQFSDINL